MVQNGQEVRHHEVDRTLTDRDKATCQQAIGIGHCIGQYRPDKRSPLDKGSSDRFSMITNNDTTTVPTTVLMLLFIMYPVPTN
eukprot:scaffold667_cov304-Chaetoceros_neogracile.AAC.2